MLFKVEFVYPPKSRKHLQAGESLSRKQDFEGRKVSLLFSRGGSCQEP